MIQFFILMSLIKGRKNEAAISMIKKLKKATPIPMSTSRALKQGVANGGLSASGAAAGTTTPPWALGRCSTYLPLRHSYLYSLDLSHRF